MDGKAKVVSFQLSSTSLATGPEARQRRVMRTLERRVLSGRSMPELRDYFSLVVGQMSSLSSGGVEDGVALTTEEDLEQMALLFAQHDIDQDGVLSRTEYAELLQLIASRCGPPYSDDHIERLFLQFDLDANGVIDLNELLLMDIGRRPRGRLDA